MRGVVICFFFLFLPLMFFYSFGAAGRSGDVAVFKAGLTNVPLVELGGPLAILAKKRHRSESPLFGFMQKHKNTIKNMGFYEVSALRMKLHHSFKEVWSLFCCFFIISGAFSVFPQRLLLVAFDVRWVFSLVGSHLKPNMPMEPFPSALSPSISEKLSGFLPGYTKTTRTGSFRHLEWTCGLSWQTASRHFHLFIL